MRATLPSLDPGDEVDVEFQTQPTGAGTIDLVLSANRDVTGVRGRWIRIAVP